VKALLIGGAMAPPSMLFGWCLRVLFERER
jgi:hypothetical protein